MEISQRERNFLALHDSTHITSITTLAHLIVP